jgi:elongation factor Ts
MSKVDINLLKKLRSITNAPLKDCKKALIEANGDLDEAQEVLRKMGALKAAKKADRETSEGIVRVRKEGDTLVAVQLACETDFVAKNEQFVWFADKILDKLLSFDKEEINSISDLSEDELSQLNDIVSEAVAVIGENIKIKDVLKKKVKQAYIYEHPGSKIVGIVVYNSNNPEAENVAKELALQAVAMNPEYISLDRIPEDIMKKMEEEFKQEVLASGKPENIVDNIVKGKLNKYFGEMTLLEQPWIRDDTKKVKSIIPSDFELIDVIRYSI